MASKPVEVGELDDLILGHSRLKDGGREPPWSSRWHILGCQVFDHWKDSWRDELGHRTGGDFFTAAHDSKKTILKDLLKRPPGRPVSDARGLISCCWTGRTQRRAPTGALHQSSEVDLFPAAARSNDMSWPMPLGRLFRMALPLLRDSISRQRHPQGC
jgi:hypothetical protein